MRVHHVLIILVLAAVIAAMVPFMMGGRPSAAASSPADEQAVRPVDTPILSAAGSRAPAADLPRRQPVPLLTGSPVPAPATSTPVAAATTAARTPTPVTVTTASECDFRLGFGALRDLIGVAVVGDCASPALYDGQGNAMQATTNGALLWHKADNWTAFTDGQQTWVYGPFGLQVRPSQSRFPWEQ